MAEWKEFSVAINAEAAEPVSAIMEELGSAGVSILDRKDLEQLSKAGPDSLWGVDEEFFPEEGVVIKGYFTTFDDVEQVEQELNKRINKLKDYGFDISLFKLEVTDVVEEEWANAWKKHYHPVAVTRFLTIVPQWEEYAPNFLDERVCYLDPGLAFGTGTHPTTQLCIQALETLVRKDDTILDVGTGSGVLSIVSALYGAGTIKAYDLDEVAVNSARSNIRLNNLEDQIAVQANNLLHGIDAEADIIVANILAEIILLFVEDAYRKLKQGGHFIMSGIISEKKDEVIEECKKYGFTIVQVNQMNDWVAIIAKKEEEDV
ncbi:Ribosomal protein L11 methyltransferase [Alkalibacterium sp. AK22]|uniref:50S ribosomal protein L11 methyltransferase n=1 Tax=Alkalibacterium sp. AK22 TaxID=1229520 RepID=UPI000446C2A1|nr:50S ribosomal protein L11 methyltransferase [Alkalibacterium sp. AK22]EXJ24117.1 Ribosomal protein L11 methyltransferase [Alkalibacterium sp. AK22]